MANNQFLSLSNSPLVFPLTTDKFLPRTHDISYRAGEDLVKQRLDALLLRNFISKVALWNYCGSQMYVAGGSIARCFRSDYQPESSHDIDLYFIARDSDAVRLHIKVFLDGLRYYLSSALTDAIENHMPHPEIPGCLLFYGQSALCEIHSPYLSNPIQIIPFVDKNFSGQPSFLNTFDFSHLQIAYANQQLTYSDAARLAYATGTSASNPFAKRIHAYRFVKTVLQGWNISVTSSAKQFITNFHSCNYELSGENPRTSLHPERATRCHYDPSCFAWTHNNLDIEAMSRDPTILDNLERKKFSMLPEYYSSAGRTALLEAYKAIFDSIEFHEMSSSIKLTGRHVLDVLHGSNVLV